MFAYRFGVIPPLSPSVILGTLAISLAPLQASYIRNISFGYDVSPVSSTEFGHFTLQYKPGFSLINGQNESVEWMTMTVGSSTRDLVRNGVVTADYFGFAFYPETQRVQIGTGSSSYLGFAPGFFIYGIGLNFWEIRQASTRNITASTEYAPLNYIRVSEARSVADDGATCGMMLGGLLCIGMASSHWRRQTSVRAFLAK